MSALRPLSDLISYRQVQRHSHRLGTAYDRHRGHCMGAHCWESEFVHRCQLQRWLASQLACRERIKSLKWYGSGHWDEGPSFKSGASRNERQKAPTNGGSKKVEDVKRTFAFGLKQCMDWTSSSQYALAVTQPESVPSKEGKWVLSLLMEGNLLVGVRTPGIEKLL